MSFYLKVGEIRYNTFKFQKMVKKLSKAEEQAIKMEQRGSHALKEEDLIYCEDNSTLPGIQHCKKENQVLASQGQNQLQKTKVISKEKAVRSFRPEDRFMQAHIKRYYLFPFYYSTLLPFFKISWKNWKPNGIYKKMAEFLSNLPEKVANKTPSQCKSYDQRMKYLHYESPHESQQLDLLQAAINNLQNYAQDPDTNCILRSYLQKMQKRSAYIQFLSDGNGMKESDALIPEQLLVVDVGVKTKCELVEIKSQRNLIFNEFFDEEYARVF